MATHPTSRATRTRKSALAGLAVTGAGIWLALTIAAPATAVLRPAPITPVYASAMPNPGTANAPTYTPQDTDPRTEHDAGPNPASIALGGIALAGAGLGITLGVQHRRDHKALHTS